MREHQCKGIVAFVDESEPHQQTDPGTYILTATLCSRSDIAAIRTVLKGLKPRGSAKLHWKDEPARRRVELVGALSALPLDHVIVVRKGPSAMTSERRRRLCLTRMFHELAERGVDELIAESRGPADDRRDRGLLDALRAQRQVPATLRLDHRPGPSEPVLWAADCVAGAIASDRTRGTSLSDSLLHQTTLVEIDAG